MKTPRILLLGCLSLLPLSAMGQDLSVIDDEFIIRSTDPSPFQRDTLTVGGNARIRADGRAGTLFQAYNTLSINPDRPAFLHFHQSDVSVTQGGLGYLYQITFDTALPTSVVPSGTAPTGWTPIVAPWITASYSIPGTESGTLRPPSFLRQDESGALSYALPTHQNTFGTADAFSIVETTANTSLVADTSVHALVVRGNVTGGAGHTLTVQSGGILFSAGGTRRIESHLNFNGQDAYLYDTGSARTHYLSGGISNTNHLVIGAATPGAALQIRGNNNSFGGKVSLINTELILDANSSGDDSFVAGRGLNRSGSTINLDLGAGSTFNLTGANQRIGTLSGSGNITNASRSAVSANAQSARLRLEMGEENSSTYDGILSDTEEAPLSLELASGNIKLTGNHTYRGTTTVEAGELHLSGSLANTAAVSVLTEGVLSGSGSIAATTSISGTLASDATGALSFGNDLTFTDNAKLTILENAAAQGFRLTGSSANLTFSGDVRVSLNLTGGIIAGEDYVILSWADAGTQVIGFDPDRFHLTNSGISGAFRLENQSIVFQSIPEGNTAAMLLLAAGGAFWINRRQWRSSGKLFMAAALVGGGVSGCRKASIPADPAALQNEAHHLFQKKKQLRPTPLLKL